MARPKSKRVILDCKNKLCKNTFEITESSFITKKHKLFCSKKCSNSDINEINKMKQTQQKTWKSMGGHPMSTQTVQNKHKQSMLLNHGVEHALQNKEILNKAKKSTIDRFGNCNNIEKVKATKLEKYGNVGYNGPNKRHISKFNDIIDKWKHLIPMFTEDEFSGVTSGQKYKFQCVECKYKFTVGINNGYIPACTKCARKNVSSQKSSVGELQIVEFIKGLISDNIKTHDRVICNGHELDILIPSYNLAIEFNGIYWHSFSKHKTDKYHLNKTKLCACNGINLFHIYDYQWFNKQNIVKSMLVNKLHKSTKLYARKCNIKVLKTKQKNEFLEDTHLQGKCNSSINLGLYYNNELVSVMTFGKSRYDKTYDYELIRFSTKLNTTVVGGFSKLLKYFINNYKPNNILSYADRTISDGNVYIKNGFILNGVTKPNFYYFKDNNIYSRQSFQKHLISSKLKYFNPTLTEYENMRLNGFDKFYNCGNYKFIYINK
jgi:hypothetical protein